MSSRREAAAADMLLDKGRQAAQLERAARQANLSAFVERKTTEQVSAAGTHQVRVAEEAARRADEQLAEAERSLEAFKRKAAAADVDAEQRFAAVKAGVEHRLAEAEGDAQARAKLVDQAVAEETSRTEAVIEQEREKLRRQYILRDTACQRQRVKMELEVQSREAAADAAERKRDREWASVQRRAERTNVAVQAKVRLAVDEKEVAAHRALLRKNHAQLETGLRLEQAKARESAAQMDLEARRLKAATALRLAEQAKATVEEECSEAIRIQKEWVEALRKQLAAKTAEWDVMVQDAEATADQKVADVRAVAAQLKGALADEVRRSEEHVGEEIHKSGKFAESHRTLVDGQLALLSQQAEVARQVAERRVAEAEALSSSQHLQRTMLAEAAEAHTRQHLEHTKTLVEGRVRKEVGLLMSYLDHGEPNSSSRSSPVPSGLELWVPVPGCSSEGGEVAGLAVSDEN